MGKIAIFIYRIGAFLYRIKLGFIGRLLSYFNRLIFSIWLPSSAKIGKHFTLEYRDLGIVIHSNTVIDKNCTVGQNVTIGRNLRDKK